MDIYKYAADIDYSADYMDMSTGNVYMIQEYGRALKFGLPTPGIRVKDSDGNDIGYAVKKEDSYG